MNGNICNIRGLLANAGYSAGSQSPAHSPSVPDDPFSITITAASKKASVHFPIMYQTDLLISKRKRSARAMRSISCLCSSNRSVSLFSGTNFSSWSGRYKPNTEMRAPGKRREGQRGTNKNPMERGPSDFSATMGKHYIDSAVWL